MKATRLTFSILMLHLITAPALPKGWLAAVPGMNILLLRPEGDIYPCHQFVGREQYKLGTLDTGVVKPD